MLSKEFSGVTAGGVPYPQRDFACRAGAARSGVVPRSPEEGMLRGGPVWSNAALPSGGCSLTASLPPGGGSSSARTEPAVRTVRGSAPPELQGVWRGDSGCPEDIPAATWLCGRSGGHPGWEHVGVTPLCSEGGGGCARPICDLCV